MEHLAIMRKSWGLTKKILSGEKTIESRWYKSKYPPWDKIREGEKVYFKDSGEPATIVAGVERVLQFEDLTPYKVKQVLEEYGERAGITSGEISRYSEMFGDKKYCILIFLNDPREIEPFRINKNGFGMGSAWICVNDINVLKSLD